MSIKKEILESLAERPKTLTQLILELDFSRSYIRSTQMELLRDGLITFEEIRKGATGKPLKGWALTSKGKEVLMK